MFDGNHCNVTCYTDPTYKSVLRKRLESKNEMGTSQELWFRGGGGGGEGQAMRGITLWADRLPVPRVDDTEPVSSLPRMKREQLASG